MITYLKIYQGLQYLWFVCFFLIELVPCPVLGQELTKKKLAEADYNRWSTLTAQKISPDGNWVSYTISYTASDTLYVKNTKTRSLYAFPYGHTGNFIGNDRFAFLDKKGLLSVLKLKDGKTWNREKVLRYDWSRDKKWMMLLIREKDDRQTLLITDLSGKEVTRQADISEYIPSNKGNAVLFTSLDGGYVKAGLIHFGKTITKKNVLSERATLVGKTCWSSDDNAVALLLQDTDEDTPETSLYLYQLQSDKLHTLKDSDTAMLTDKKLAYPTDMELRISSDNNQVFFAVQPKGSNTITLLPENVEVWKGSDTVLYPMRKKLQGMKKQPAGLAVWNSTKKTIHGIGKGNIEAAILVNLEKYALTCELFTGQRFALIYPPRDYHLTNTLTGKSELLLQGLQGAPSEISASPDGRYIAYYKDHNWWLYDLDKRKHTNCTESTPTNWDRRATDPGYTDLSFGVAGWSTDGALLLYDADDIWAVNPLNSKITRLTRGKEKHLKYRLARADIDYSGITLPYSPSVTAVLNLNKELILSYADLFTGRYGYSVLKPGGHITPLTKGPNSATRLGVTALGKQIIYEEQSFETSPRIIAKDMVSGNEKIIIQSNRQQQEYQWGRHEVLHYTVGVDTLKAALLYPHDYDSSKRYPMITYIYEKVSAEAYQYTNPSLHNSTGLNLSNLTAKGYFILLPDIRYKKGHAGMSAVECVTAAVEKAVSLGNIIPDKIGLVGHSFGGYEANFILTHTKLFSAAVSGASLSDPVAGAMTYSEGTGFMEYWRLEQHQFRIGKSLYEEPQLYLENSPLMNADSITTPLLIWAGKSDRILTYTQSVALYAALRRLKKDTVMLLYPLEGHTLARTENQADLTRRVESWFGYYLKGEPASWIKEPL